LNLAWVTNFGIKIHGFGGTDNARITIYEPTTQARYYFIQHFGHLQAGRMIETIFENHRAHEFDDYLLLYADPQFLSR
jgi:hypothetical protein